MSQVGQRTRRAKTRERRQASGTRALALLFVAALALVASSCAGAQQQRDVNAGTVAPQPPVADMRAPSPQNSNASGASAYSFQKDAPEGGAEGGAGERYAKIDENPFLEASRAPLSTFSIDVDTASYSNTRRFIGEGQLPPRDAVRIEELVNYFSYDYPQPSGDAPFSVTSEVADCPWNTRHGLVHIGLQGRRVWSSSLTCRAR
jgi:Ca-activated chloride channel homolog